ncbi:hypothetical protein [Paraburkholderia susongensis]|nr:hypothetical protein [Paraburkholderia susongensis]
MQGVKKTGSNRYSFGSSAYTLSGTPQQSGELGMRACVGTAIGSYTVGSYANDDQYSVTVFDAVQWQKAQNPRAIDVYIDNTFQQRVRY